MNVALRSLRTGVATLALAGTVAVTGQVVLTPSASASYGTVQATTAVNVRASATTSSAIVGVLYPGQTAQQVGDVTQGFVPISFGGGTRYVSADWVTGASPGSASASPSSSPSPSNSPSPTAPPSPSTVTGTVYALQSVHVRVGPSLGDRVVGVLIKGRPATATGVTSGSWTQVTIDGATRWISSGYLSTGVPTAPSVQGSYTVSGHARTTTPLMIRTASGSSFVSLGDLPTGTIVDLTGMQAAGVSQVVYQGVLRWVNSSFLVPVSDTTQPSPPPPPATVGTRYATVALDIRATPAYTTTVITEVPTGTALKITGTVSGDYAQVVWDGVARWVTAKYLSTTQTLNTGGSVGLDNLTGNGKVIVTTVRAQFPQITTMYGVRPDPLPDHPSGHAVDIMLPNYQTNEALGWTIANYMRAHATDLHISYIIFHQHIWNIARDSEGWRLMADRGSDTANHMNHVHVTVF